MNPNGDGWQGLVRRNALAQDIGREQDERTQKTPRTPPVTTPQERLHQDLVQLQTKTAQHLQPPATPGLRMGKFKMFLLFLLFLLAGALFFVGGFLTCYTVFPPRPVSITEPLDISGGSYSASQLPQGLAGAPAAAGSNDQASYARRQAMLRGGNQGNLLDQAETRTQYAASVQARNAVGRVLNKVSQGMRSTLGPYLGSAIEPLTTGLARSAINQALPLNQRGSWSTAKASTQGGTPLQEGAPSAQGTQSGPSSPGGYTILVQECSSSEESLSLSDSLRAQGFGAYVAKEQTPSGQASFVVKAGQFATYQEARDAAALLGRQIGRPARVALLRPAM